MKVGKKLREARSLLEHAPGFLLVKERASLQQHREEWDFVVRSRHVIRAEESLQLMEPGNPQPELSFEVPKREVVSCRQSTLWPATGLLSTSSGTLITDSAFGPDRLQEMIRGRPFNRYPVLTIDDLPCASFEAGEHSGDHARWMLEALPRIWALQHPEVQELGPIHLLVGDRTPAAKEEVIRAILPRQVQLKKVPDRSRVQARRFLLLPFFSIERYGYLPPEYLDFFRARVLDALGIPKNLPRTRKILISRVGSARRKLLNEEALFRELESVGFELHRLEDLSLGAQAALFAQAEVVVGVHGAAFSNLVYARDCRVIEVFPGPASPEFRVLAASCGHRYQAIVGDGFDRDANLVLRFEEVMRALELMESRPPALLRLALGASKE
jgi:hypothetical protein